MAPSLIKRQNTVVQNDPGDDDGSWWWYSGTAVAVKWAILAGILLLFIVFFVGGYYHAQRRMKKGLPPLAYHRWLLPRRQRIRFEPHLAERRYFYQRPERHSLNPYPAPPPAYNADETPLPQYAPPDAPSKVKPDHTLREVPPASESSRGNSASRPYGEPPPPAPAYSNGGHDVWR